MTRMPAYSHLLLENCSGTLFPLRLQREKCRQNNNKQQAILHSSHTYYYQRHPLCCQRLQFHPTADKLFKFRIRLLNNYQINKIRIEYTFRKANNIKNRYILLYLGIDRIWCEVWCAVCPSCPT